MVNQSTQRLAAAGCILALCLLFLTLAVEREAAAQAVDDPSAALAMLARLNEWRLEQGVWPLKPNDTLRALALDQASYLSTLSDIPGGTAMHLGRGGEGPRERALYPQFNWPSYGGSAAIAEVGAVGSPDSALNFWKNSDIHRETINNPVFREIGVAAVPHPWGHIYIAVLGSRPDVLPALVDPRDGSLHLTQDAFKFGPGSVPPMQILLFDAAGRALNNGEWLNWLPVLPLAADVGGKVYVVYSDGSSKSLAEVELARDQIILPGYLPGPETVPIPTGTPAATTPA